MTNVEKAGRVTRVLSFELRHYFAIRISSFVIFPNRMFDDFQHNGPA